MLPPRLSGSIVTEQPPIPEYPVISSSPENIGAALAVSDYPRTAATRQQNVFRHLRLTDDPGHHLDPAAIEKIEVMD